ncbi:DUF4932 domain-containing protein [Sphingobacterium yanglingense]|uniref:Uncharacterized protein DUF4932 n=1 Tax=Sphingobacterium yanglingense TaxID=1437280 RepID=A0A4R6WPU7_9SPHI|nr:DUF4932 domain-containing protein [Sphingobacterium yanglingense]TDQ78305.1 uncharacterized protein DUF4932 [Sphingobacterium yanglingense]
MLFRTNNKLKVTGILILSIFSLSTQAQHNAGIQGPLVDRRIELVSIVFRLAECREYSLERFKKYTDEIQNHFGPYKNHELINFVKDIRKTKGIGYDATMAMAIHLDSSLNPITDFSDSIPSYRWGQKDANEFVRLLKSFYVDTDFESLFDKQQQLYASARDRFSPIFKKLDFDWFNSFYGKVVEEKFVVVNALGNGGANYAATAQTAEGKTTYAIMGAWETDDVGMVCFKMNDYFPILVHELNHPFVNYLLENNPEPFRKSGEALYSIVGDKMKKQAYTSWEAMLNEAMVRAAVIKYMQDHHFAKGEIQAEMNTQIDKGFLWIEDLVQELHNYANNRHRYPSLEAYMPNIAKAYDSYASRYSTKYR